MVVGAAVVDVVGAAVVDVVSGGGAVDVGALDAAATDWMLFVPLPNNAPMMPSTRHIPARPAAAKSTTFTPVFIDGGPVGGWT